MDEFERIVEIKTRGEYFLSQFDHSSAIQTLTQIQNCEFPIVHYLLAEAYYFLKMYKLSLESLKKAKTNLKEDIKLRLQIYV
jgi:hypothetical protein